MPWEDLAEVQNIVSDLFEYLEAGNIDLRKDTVERIDSELLIGGGKASNEKLLLRFHALGNKIERIGRFPDNP
jgi:hypothetical protein